MCVLNTNRYAQGLLTGLVMDSGDGVSHCIPVKDGYSFPQFTKRLNVAGRHCTTFLCDLLRLQGYNFNRTADFDTVRQMKEDLCYVAYDYEKELLLARNTTVLVKEYVHFPTLSLSLSLSLSFSLFFFFFFF